ncbi:TonB-dependent receptor [Paraglaciecola sp.]|uniref:TonB-dependent receptor n=1 Tax=Paraglaciecola sp. TaxID=1920173 RepID=UPI003EF24465
MNIIFKKTRLAAGVSLVFGTTAIVPIAVAQELNASDDTEIIQVSGIRSSMQESMLIKRDSQGVVDAISAEDMGKFPDTNLAESLQRISGVSINRSNGEGSQVTVRGFGSGNNMVTLNGRNIPGGGTSGGSNNAGRGFEFSNLASESVKAVEVYKTSKAEIATGGIGATINIITAKPFDNEGFVSSFGAKLAHDTTNRAGDDVTPELSGIVSYNHDSVFGVSATYSHQQRDSGAAHFEPQTWRYGEWVSAADIGATNVINPPAVGQIFAMPNQIKREINDTQRTRNNAQLTMQYSPVESLTATLDYSWARNDIEIDRYSINAWSTRRYDEVTFDTGDYSTATGVHMVETLSGTKDFNNDSMLVETENELKSLGLNIEYQVNDDFTVTFDAHDSSMESRPDSDNKWGSNIRVPTAIAIGTSQTWDFTGDLPYFSMTVDDSVKGNGNGVADVGDISSQMMIGQYTYQNTDTKQYKIEGNYEFDDGSFSFGVDSREVGTRILYSRNVQRLGTWGVRNPMDVPSNLVSEFDIVAEFDDYTQAGEHFAWKSDVQGLIDWAEGEYDLDATFNDAYQRDDFIVEDTLAAYIQMSTFGELGGKEFNVLAGLRYEETDVLATAYARPTEMIIWEGNNDFRNPSVAEITAVNGGTKYDHFLPSLDFDIALSEQLKGRASFSQTIARAGYSSLRATKSVSRPDAPTLTGGQSRASTSNPGLVPLLSNNIDFSLEYYIDDVSYISVGFFEKRVKNFIGTGQEDETHFGLRDVTNGPRALAAQAALQAGGFEVTEDSLFAMTAVLDNPDVFTNGAADYLDDGNFWTEVENAYDIFPNDEDPLIVFETSAPRNNKEAKIYGFEFAGQHFFGDSGFGVSTNYTLVRGDVNFDNEAPLGSNQFSLNGLSDTANLVLMFENDDIQARIAYNWRDEFLSSGGLDPKYIEAYSQVDVNFSYIVSEELTVSFNGLNLTEENARQHGRSPTQVFSIDQLGARYQIGARYKF